RYGCRDAVINIPATSSRYLIGALNLTTRSDWQPWFDDTEQELKSFLPVGLLGESEMRRQEFFVFVGCLRAWMVTGDW
ncbi:hypothetical protein IFM89_008853, partial [Coptis chinensis]